MSTAKVFKSGNSQAVRLPKEFRFKGETVEISRKGDSVVMRERRETLADALKKLKPMPDFMKDGLPDDPPPEPLPKW